jgi:hypothetical protein
MTRHISISVNGAFGKVPDPKAVDWIARELGLVNPLQPLMSYIERRGEDHPAINLIEKLTT